MLPTRVEMAPDEVLKRTWCNCCCMCFLNICLVLFVYIIAINLGAAWWRNKYRKLHKVEIKSNKFALLYHFSITMQHLGMYVAAAKQEFSWFLLTKTCLNKQKHQYQRRRWWWLDDTTKESENNKKNDLRKNNFFYAIQLILEF